ncbi:unnamed protein product [Cyclocybe aegerita]|uniref:Uncharacterized protein n=1 Tax=Cyclocybe aegerita TaxID=1973307 RepID=A0A8S0VZI3_CYCAE|nr:unnamed protein product [Cyclocybe aegerita]
MHFQKRSHKVGTIFKGVRALPFKQRPKMISSSSNVLSSPAVTPASGEKTSLPGFGLPLNYGFPSEGKDSRFPSALLPEDIKEGRTTLALTTLREFKMLQIMNQITDKPDWHTKVFDETIAAKWKSEAIAQDARGVSKAMMNWVIDELRYKAKIFEQTGAISVFTGDVVKSDSALPESFKLELQAAVKPLEDIPAKDKDWHPGSKKMVLDLVHPSLFPLVYGRSKVLESGRTTLEDCIAQCGEGVVIPVPSERRAQLKCLVTITAWSSNHTVVNFNGFRAKLISLRRRRKLRATSTTSIQKNIRHSMRSSNRS